MGLEADVAGNVYVKVEEEGREDYPVPLDLKDWNERYSIARKKGDDCIHIISLYEISWDWLMPVVEEIETRGSISPVVEISLVETRIGDNVVRNCGSRFNNTYQAVGEFIEYYNKHK